MYVIREVLHCKPGKVRPMLEKFRSISALMKETGQQPLRLLTDVTAQPFWTIVAEATVDRAARPRARENTRSMMAILDQFSAQPQGIVAGRAHQLLDLVPRRQGGVGGA